MRYFVPDARTTGQDVRGQPLRYLLVSLLADAPGPLTVGKLAALCQARGVQFQGRSSKTTPDTATQASRRSTPTSRTTSERATAATGPQPRSEARAPVS